MRANFVFSEVATGLRRNLTMTIAMIITTAISLCLFGAGLLIADEIGEMRKVFSDKLEVAVYLKDSIAEPDRTALEGKLKGSPEVETVTYIDKAAAYKRFTETSRETQPELVSAVGPTDLPASYQVKLKNPQRYQVLATEFQGSPGVDQVQSQAQLLDRLFGLLNGMRNATVILAVMQAVAALLLISNTIQVAAFTRRTETGIMRLVGASRWYTQLPFLLEAAVAGLIGAALAVGGLFAGKALFIDKALKVPIQNGILPPMGYDTIIGVMPTVTIAGIALACVAAYTTLRFYVRL